MTKKILSIMIATATILSLLCCIPVSAAYASAPYVYCDFNDTTDAGFFYAGYNSSGTDSIVEGVAGSRGAFQRSYSWKTDPDGGFLVSSKVTFPTEWFYGLVKVSFWFKIDPTVGELLTTTAEDGTVTSNLYTMHPRFYVESNKKEIQGENWIKTGWDVDALNRGEWVFIEMIGVADGVIDDYELQPTDTIKLEIRPNAVSNSTSQNWTSTGNLCFAVDDFKVEKVVDAYDSEGEDAATYTYPWAEDLEINGKLESNRAWGDHTGSNGTASTAYSGDNKVTLSYAYKTNDSTTAEGSSLVRVLRETAAGSGKYAVVEQFIRTDSNSFTYQLSEDWIGRRIKMEVVPIDANGVFGATYSVVSDPVKSSADPSIRLNFNESTETGSGRFFMGRTDAIDTSVRGANGSGAALNRTATLSSTCGAPFLQHVFTTNPKDLFMGNFKISLWFKLNAEQTQLDTSKVSQLMIVLQPNGGANALNMQLPFPANQNVNDGEWMYLEYNAYEINKYNGFIHANLDAANMNLYQAADDQQYTMTVRVGTFSNAYTNGIVTSEGNVLSYCIDDFKIEKVIAAYDSEDEDAAFYAYPWAEDLEISGTLESNGAWGDHTGSNGTASTTYSADNKVTLSYTYGSNDSATAEGSSLVRLLRETAAESGEYDVIEQYTRTDSNSFTYELSEDWIGRRMKMEVVPIDANGVYGTTYSIVSDPVKSSADPSIRLGFNESTETGAGRFFMGRTDTTDTTVRGANGSGAALKREATLSSSCTAPFLQHIFTTNPKDLFMGNFKISLWFKLNAEQTQLDTSKVSQLMIVLQPNGGANALNMQLPFPTDQNVNDGEWMYLEYNAYEINKYNGFIHANLDAANMNLYQAADDQQYTMTVRVGTFSNAYSSAIVTSEGNVLSYCIDDFKIEKIVDSYSADNSNYGRPYLTGVSVTGNMVSGSDLEVSYNYNIDRTANTESDNSVIRVLRETAVGSNMYGLVKSYTKKEFLEEGYTLTDAWLGKKMKLEIIPVAADGTYGATYTAISDPVMAEYQVSTTLTDLASSITATASVINNSRDAKDDSLVLYVAVYGDHNKLIKVEKDDFVVPNTVATAQTATATEVTFPVALNSEELAAAKQVKVFLWTNDGKCVPLLAEKTK